MNILYILIIGILSVAITFNVIVIITGHLYSTARRIGYWPSTHLAGNRARLCSAGILLLILFTIFYLAPNIDWMTGVYGYLTLIAVITGIVLGIFTYRSEKYHWLQGE